MRNIKLALSIPYTLANVKTSIGKIEDLTPFQSRLLTVFVGRDEIIKKHPELQNVSTTFEQMLKIAMNVESRMHIFIENDLKQLFITGTLYRKFGNDDKDINWYNEPFANILLNENIAKNLLNFRFVSLSERKRYVNENYLFSICSFNNEIAKAYSLNNYSTYAENEFDKQAPIIVKHVINKDKGFIEGHVGSILHLDEKKETVEKMEILDINIVSIEEEFEFELKDKEILVSSVRTKKLVDDWENDLIFNDLVEEFETKLDFNDYVVKELTTATIVVDEIERSDDIVSNKNTELSDINLPIELFFDRNSVYEVVKVPTTLMFKENKINIKRVGLIEVDLLQLLSKNSPSISWKEINSIRDSKLTGTLMQVMIEKGLVNKNIEFVENNISNYKFNIDGLKKVLPYVEINTCEKLLIKYRNMTSDFDFIQFVKDNTPLSYEDLYKLYNWAYGEERIFVDWKKEDELFKYIEYTNENESLLNSKNLSISEYQQIIKDIKRFDFSPINYPDRDKLISIIEGRIKIASDLTTKQVTELAINSRIELERIAKDLIGDLWANDKSFAENLNENCVENKELNYAKKAYSLFSKYAHYNEIENDYTARTINELKDLSSKILEGHLNLVLKEKEA